MMSTAINFAGSGDPAWTGADPDPAAPHGGPARLPAQVTQHESAIPGQGGPLPPPRQPTTRQRRQQGGQRRQCSQVLVE
jgi:hypothetical protein